MDIIISQRRRPTIPATGPRPALARQAQPEHDYSALIQAGNKPLEDSIVEDVAHGAIDDVIGDAVETEAGESPRDARLSREELDGVVALEERQGGCRRMQDRSLARSWLTESSARCLTAIGNF